MFYAYLYNNSISHYTVDFSNWIDIPPQTYRISTTKDPIQLRPGNNEIVGAEIKSTFGTIPKIVSIHTVNNSLPIGTNILSDTSDNKANELRPSSIKLDVSQKAQVGKYSIPVLANISTGSTFLPKILYVNIYSLPISIPTEGYTIIPLNLTVQVLEPLTFGEWFKEGWETYGNFISLLSGGFFAGAASLVLDRLKKNRSSKNGHKNNKQN